MKVSELNGDQIDHWVARAEGIHVKYSTTRQYWRIVDDNEEIPWSPCQDWAQGGPIIEREKIALRPDGKGPWRATQLSMPDEHQSSARETMQEGPTALEAAMKCYIAAKFGEEVGDL